MLFSHRASLLVCEGIQQQEENQWYQEWDGETGEEWPEEWPPEEEQQQQGPDPNEC